jgi:hypothetical protein
MKCGHSVGRRGAGVEKGEGERERGERVIPMRVVWLKEKYGGRWMREKERISMARTEYSVLKEVSKYHECGWSKASPLVE